MLMPSQDMTLSVYPGMSGHGALLPASFKNVYNFLIKTDDTTI